MGFYNEMKSKYNELVMKQLKYYNSIILKLARMENKRNFLLNCRRMDLEIPCTKINISHLDIKFSRKKIDNIIQDISRKILNIIIIEAISEIKQLRKEKERLETYIFTRLESIESGDYITKQDEYYKTQYKLFKQKYSDKLQQYYIRTYKKAYNNNSNTNWLINCTDKQIPEYAQNILSMGHNFNLPYNNQNIPIAKIISSIETCISKEENAEIIRPEVNNILVNFINKKTQEKKKHTIFEIDARKTKKFIKDNDDIIVCRADKGNSTVIMDKKDYLHKAKQLLQDSSTYKKINRDPTNKIQKEINNITNQCIQQNIIDKRTGMQWKSLNTTAPVIYFVPKVHKKDIPLRPIVSTIKSPTYNIAKYINNSLKHCMHYNYQIKDSWNFVEYIKKLENIPNDHKIVSFDVSSLFTNIPIDLAIKIIRNKWDLISAHTSLTEELFNNAIKLCLETTYFRYNDEFFQQIFGVPMGSPLSGIIANIVMEHIEEQIIKSLPFKLLFYKRYVDDIIICLPEHLIPYTFYRFNSFHERIKFTKEIEINEQISFLDILLKRDNGHIKINWYTKPTWSGRYLNYKSENPMIHKINSLNAILDRAIKFTAVENRPTEIKKVKNTFIQNNYPVELVNKQIRRRLARSYNSFEKKTKDRMFTSIPYVKDLSEKLNKIITKYTKTKALAYKPANTIQKIFSKIKYINSKEKTCNVIYKLDCECGAAYIGETKQQLHKRMVQHKSNVKLKQIEVTALAKHAVENNHKFDFNNVQILENEENYNKRLILEMIHIVKNDKAVNNKRDTEGLSNTYFNTIRKIKQIR